MRFRDVWESLPQFHPTTDDVSDNRAWRERYEPDPDARPYIESVKPSREDLRKLITPLVSDDANKLIIDFEVGGQAEYMRKTRFPERPPAESGITIGCGYDLGYTSPEEFEADWKDKLSPTTYEALHACLGVKGSAADRFLPDVRNFDIPWEAAIAVYKDVTIPKYGSLALGIFPGADKLHPHCFGALTSLVFNRGSKMSGDGRLEMRNIRDAIRNGAIDTIPDEFRRMKRLWPEIKGLQRRRDAEAALFERGYAEWLSQQRTFPTRVAAATGAAAGSATLTESMANRERVAAALSADEPIAAVATGDGDLKDIPDDVYFRKGGAASPQLEARSAESQIHWIENDDLSVDYHHIRSEDRQRLKDAHFLFSAADLKLMIGANFFEPRTRGRRVIFGLRGALLDHDRSTPEEKFRQIERQSLHLVATRPNHRDFRCVIGVWNLDTDMLSGFMASTVPNQHYVYAYANGGSTGNMLATGCYTYTVGTHKGRCHGCLRQTEASAVLRMRDKFAYEITDIWDVKSGDNMPFDNIHPAYGEDDFSSAGCQVIRGNFDDEYSLQFAEFRAALGLKTPPGADDGVQYSYVLLTGLEAAIAAELRTAQKDTDANIVRERLVRLRQGSRGEYARRLQDVLKTKVDGVFSGTNKLALVAKQRDRDKTSGDGVFSPAIDAQWSANVFADPAPQPLPPAAIIVSAASPAVTGRSLERNGSAMAEDASLQAIYYEIGRRAGLAQDAPERLTEAVLPHYEAIDAKKWSEGVGLGQKIVGRLERMMQELVCGELDADKSDRQKIRASLFSAVKLGPEAFTGAVSKALSGWLMVPPIVATPVAEIIVNRLWTALASDTGGALDQQMGTMCRLWHQRLYPEMPDGAAPSKAPAAMNGAATSAGPPPPTGAANEAQNRQRGQLL